MPDHAYRDDGVYCVRVYPVRDKRGGGERVRYRTDGYYTGHRQGTLTRTTFASVEDAEKCAALLWQDYVQGLHAAPQARPVTVQDLVDAFCERTTSKRGKTLSDVSTGRSYPSQLQALTRVTGPDLPLTHLGQRHVEAVTRLANQRTGEPLSRASVESYLRAISALVQWAIRQGFLSTDITQGVTYDAGPAEMRPWLQPTEVEPFLAACSPAHRIRAGFLIETGLRASEAVHLRWAWVQRGIGRPAIRVPARDPVSGFTAKGKQARAVPLSTRAQGLLDEARERWGGIHYVLHGADTPIRSDNWCADTHAACQRAGTTDIDTHGLRRTAGALWLASGLDIYRVSRLLGHQSVTTTERAYAGLADGHLASAMDLVDARGALPSIGSAAKGRDVKDGG